MGIRGFAGGGGARRLCRRQPRRRGGELDGVDALVANWRPAGLEEKVGWRRRVVVGWVDGAFDGASDVPEATPPAAEGPPRLAQ